MSCGPVANAASGPSAHERGRVGNHFCGSSGAGRRTAGLNQFFGQNRTIRTGARSVPAFVSAEERAAFGETPQALGRSAMRSIRRQPSLTVLFMFSVGLSMR